MIALHPHGHDRTSYDIAHCCLCSPESGKHKFNERNQCTVCGVYMEEGKGDHEAKKPETL